MALNAATQFYLEIPPVTRIYTTACVLTTLVVHLNIISPLQLYYNPHLILYRLQLWRFITTFLFFGSSVGMGFFFNIIFTYRYCRMLEEGSFRGRSSDFVVMFVFGATLMAILGVFMNLLFLGQAFTLMFVYVWSRRNPFIRMNILGIVNFQAPYLPWVLLCFSMILGNAIWIDIVGMSVGHIYFFLEDVFPRLHNGRKLLNTPTFLKILFNEQSREAFYSSLPPEERPDGFLWNSDDNETMTITSRNRNNINSNSSTTENSNPSNESNTINSDRGRPNESNNREDAETMHNLRNRQRNNREVPAQ